MSKKFHYFGFGSNLLARRIHMQHPTAARIGSGKLENYRLDFNTISDVWRGARATIVPMQSVHVYGAIWAIDCANLKDLDQRECVDVGIYVPISVLVLSLENNCYIECRTYHLTEQPVGYQCILSPDEMPLERQPSKSYLKTMVKGAMETGLPEAYISWLRTLKHNRKMVEIFEKSFELLNVQLNANVGQQINNDN